MQVELVVVGLGYVGLPVLIEASRAGLRCVGLDLDAKMVGALSAGRSHVDDISDEQVVEALAQGSSFSTSPDCLAGAGAVVICVPTPLDEHQAPDLSAVRAVGSTIAEGLQRGTLVVLESTTYPGTTDTLLREILERSGLRAGHDFHLAFSPERIDPGNSTFGLRNTPKVVGGFTAGMHRCGRGVVRAIRRHGRAGERAPRGRDGKAAREHLSPCEHRTRQRDGGVLPRARHRPVGVDRAAETKPFGFAAFRPGPGSGATAFRSIRTISPIRCAHSGTSSDSSNWPRRSATGCPPTWSPECRRP